MFLAIGIFIVIYAAIASEQFPRHWVALLGGGVLVLFGVLNLTEALTYISWETLGLLSGMFVLVATLSEAGFFLWLAMTAIRKVNYKPVYLFAILMLMATFLAMFMDSITVMLFLSALTLQLCQLLKLDPIPLVIAEVCAANTGGAATLVGDPPNVILGTTLGFGFNDFVTHTGPISAIAALLLLVIFLLHNRKALREAHATLDAKAIADIESLHGEPVHAHLTRIGLINFLLAVGLLIFHIPLSHLSGLPITAAVAALVPAGLALIALQPIERKSILRRVDGESILFFAGLFVLIGGLEKVKLFEILAETLANTTSSSPMGLVLALHWVPGLLSGIVDNVPLALAMSYVLQDLGKMSGMPALGLMVWSLALGVDIGGNLTPIGASANVVAYAFLERNHGRIGWGRWLKVALPATLVAMALASTLVILKGYIGWY
jgi:Na+/H+ antiporter NhaD/arsenite permease-like protein